MELGLDDKVAVVTGASRGIGFALAAAFAREGARVAITARDGDELEKAAATMRDAGGEVLAVAADVTDPAGCQRVVNATVQHFGRLDILVNNVGGVDSFFVTFEELTDAAWLRIFELNVMSAVRMSRAALPHMQERGWGRIVNISSESAVQPDPVMPHYNTAKGALNSLSKSLSKAYGKDNILVNTVSPAFIRTPGLEDVLAEQAQEAGVSVEQAERTFARDVRPNVVLERAGDPSEIAPLVLLLASDLASFMTGSNYRVDGGSVASV
jgi:3-oxoacyl-[acyl-carrier protein] reductase